MIRSRLCQQCLSALVRRATITPTRALHPFGPSPSAPFSTSHLAKAAFLRPGPGRELGNLFKKTSDSQPHHLQGQRTQNLSASNKTVTTAASETANHTTGTTSREPSSPTTTVADHSPQIKPLYKEIILLETDFRERFIKGGGNGGQKINKTNSNVELKHLETGIVVQCQATRSLPQNRKLARRILIGRLDEYYNGELSKRGQKAEKIRERKKRMARKSAKKYHAAGNDVESENDDDDDRDADDDEAEEEDRNRVPGAIIHSTTLEEILAGDNKKPSRRKAGRKE
ncbi:hypothetical protein BGZ72_008154 [Mortierella alpina]|nr:hypothetical protein BGZ72_008154 [Mortierella alpina]